MRLHTLETPAGPISWIESQAEGEPVLFLHGNSSNAEVFRPQFAGPPGDRFRCIAPDLPGHGESFRSQDPATDYAITGLSRFVTTFCRALELENFTGVGWSLGGHLFLEALPELEVDRLLITGSPPLKQPPEPDAFCPEPALATAFSPDADRENVRRFIDLFFAEKEADTSPHVEAFMKTDPEFRRQVAEDIARGAFADELENARRFSGPLCIVHGEEERFANLAYVQRQDFPNLWKEKIHVFSGTAHVPFVEEPQLFNDLLTEFIEGSLRD